MTIESEYDLFFLSDCVYILYISHVNKQHTPSYFFFASDKVYQLFAQSRWFSLGTPASSTTKTDRHDITEILLKIALSTINQNQPY